MSSRLFTAALAAVSLISFTSCEEVIDFNGKYDGEKIVLFSCANPESPLFRVNLTKSRFFLDASQNQHPYDVSGGEVLLIAGGKTIRLTEDKDNPGSFLTDFVPEEGSSLILEATAPGLSPVRAEVTVPSKVRIDVVPGAQKITSDSEWGVSVERHFKITIHDDGSVRNYYRITAFKEVDALYDGILYSEADSLVFGPVRQGVYMRTNDVAFMSTNDMDAIAGIIEDGSTYYIDGVYDDSFINGRDYTFEVWIDDYLRKFVGEWYGEGPLTPVEVHPEDYSGWGFEIDALSEDLYKYQRSREDYRRSDMGLGSVFAEPVSIHNNVQGGIGCFGAITPSLIMF